jgi:hypothetical protein
MADHSKPLNTSTYANYTSEIDARFDDLTLGLDSAFTTPTNLPTNAIRWNSTTFKHQRWNGTAWNVFTRYDININGTVGATTPNTGAFTTLSSTGNTTLGDASADTLTVNATPTFNVAIPATSGGTGQSSYAVGDLVYASTTTALSKLSDVATGNALISGGINTAPSYGKIGLTTHISGTLATGNGGTGLTAFTSGGAVYASSTSALTTGTLPATAGGTGFASYAIGDLVFASTTTALSKLADVATGNALISGGVGTAPSYGKIGLTTHVDGTLPVANGGTGVTTKTGTGDVVLSTSPILVTPALGTPSSGNLANCTFPTLNQSTTGNAATATYATSAGSAATATNATQITNAGGWSVTPSGGTLYFSYNGTNVGSLTSSGDFTCIGNITAYGGPL